MQLPLPLVPSLAAALAVAALFALLPIHVEPVSWVMGRKDLLVSFFMLLALLAQSHELAAPQAGRRRLLYGVALLCTVLALLSKMSAVSFFLVLALHRALHPYLDGSRAPDAPLAWASTLRRVVPRMLPHATLSIGVFLWFQEIIRAYGVVGWRGPDGLDPQHLATVARFAPLVIGQYLSHVAWPVQLSSFYRWPHVEIPLTTAELLASAAIALALAAALIGCCRRRRDLAFFGLAFAAFAALSTVSPSAWW